MLVEVQNALPSPHWVWIDKKRKVFSFFTIGVHFSKRWRHLELVRRSPWYVHYGPDFLQIVHWNAAVCDGINHPHAAQSYCACLQHVIAVYLDGGISIFGVVDLFFAVFNGFVAATYLYLDSPGYD